MKRLLGLVVATLLLSSVNVFAAVNIKFAHGEPEKQSYGVFATMFAENLKKVSNGEMNWTVFPNGVVGSEMVAGQKVKQGTLQMAIVTAANAGSFSPCVNVLTFPYLFSGPEDIMGEKGYLRPGSAFREELTKRMAADAELNFSGALALLSNGGNEWLPVAVHQEAGDEDGRSEGDQAAPRRQPGHAADMGDVGSQRLRNGVVGNVHRHPAGRDGRL